MMKRFNYYMYLQCLLSNDEVQFYIYFNYYCRNFEKVKVCLVFYEENCELDENFQIVIVLFIFVELFCVGSLNLMYMNIK